MAKEVCREEIGRTMNALEVSLGFYDSADYEQSLRQALAAMKSLSAAAELLLANVRHALVLESIDLATLKPLVWKEGRCDNIRGLYVGTVFGRYWILLRIGGSIYATWYDGDLHEHKATSIDHGKEIAFADYQSRVRGLFE